MEVSMIRKSQSSNPQSLIGDKDSRASEISSTSLLTNLKRLFDFSQTTIPGLYKVTSKYFILEYCESEAIAYSKFHVKGLQFDCKFYQSSAVLYGIQYCGYIEILHFNTQSIQILVPAFRSYDPAGQLGRQYVTSRQIMALTKLLSLEIRAAQLGVKERRMDKIKRSIETISKIPESMILLWNWVHLQIKLACYKKLQPPHYFEYILNKILSEEFSLEGRDDCKEYLEKCMKGGVVKMPSAYYRAVLEHERKLAFDLKVLYSEIEAKESKDEKASTVILTLLPKMIPNLTVVKEGKNYLKMVSDCERLYKLYESNLTQNKCKIM